MAWSIGRRRCQTVPKMAQKTVGGDARDTNQYFVQPQPADVEMSAYVIALLTYMLTAYNQRACNAHCPLADARSAHSTWAAFQSTQDNSVMALQSLGGICRKGLLALLQPGASKCRMGKQDTHLFTNQRTRNALVTAELRGPNTPTIAKPFGRMCHFIVPKKCARCATATGCSWSCAAITRVPVPAQTWPCGGDALSGYRFDEEDVRRLTGIADLQRVELDKEDSKLNIYFNALGDVPVCLSMNTDLVYQIADQRDAQLLLYDYYDPQQQMKSTYSARQTRSLEESCPDCWPDPGAHASRAQAARPSVTAGAGSSTGGAATTPSAVLFLLFFSVGLQLYLLSSSSLSAAPFWRCVSSSH
ncbi:hypothetical protein niasHT_036285 [Heterodera trifolii]|uniref:Alpha-macroglobulin receptor-binding domain-containing protein n=1 Tax=Heterodera trifolii TaxID=157864 RepID=A0ABD2I7V3_9BILA